MLLAKSRSSLAVGTFHIPVVLFITGLNALADSCQKVAARAWGLVQTKWHAEETPI
jgi:hypothetical protein